MKKTMICAAALLMASVVMTACSGGDDVTSDVTPVSQPAAEAGDVVELSGTLGSKGSTTRAIDADGNGTWEVGDQFAIYYTTTSGHASAVATVNSVNDDKSANFKATLHSPKAGDNDVKLVYPASAHDGEGGFKTDALMNQEGTLEYINANGLDIETASTTMSVEGMSAKLKGDVTMDPQVCLYALNLTAAPVMKLEIYDGTHNYTITPTSATSNITVALLPTDNADFTFSAVTNEDGMGYIYTKRNGVTLANCTSDNVGDVFDEKGNVFAVSPGTGLSRVSSFSRITLEKGKFYSQNLFISKILRPVAVIAYVGERGSVDDSEPSTETGYRGLAISMKNSTRDYTYEANKNWDTYASGIRWCEKDEETVYPCTSQVSGSVADAREQKNGITMTNNLVNNTSHHKHWAAIIARNYYCTMYYWEPNNNYYFQNSTGKINRPSGTSNWFLPSVGQWELIVWGLVSKATGTPYSTRITDQANNAIKFDKFNHILSNANADPFADSCDNYWLSSEYDNGNAWYVTYDGSVNYGTKGWISHAHVRAVIAF